MGEWKMPGADGYYTNNFPIFYRSLDHITSKKRRIRHGQTRLQNLTPYSNIQFQSEATSSVAENIISSEYRSEVIPRTGSKLHNLI